MKKTELDKIAKDYFKANKGEKSLIVTSDGQAFVNENAAKLHVNTNKAKKKLTFETYTTGVVDTSKNDEGKVDVVEFPLNEKAIKAFKLGDLQKMAEDLKIDVAELDTKQKIADAINTLKAEA
ncbi:hypothetical protein [Maribacter sp. ACAM166]|uniref:hypothetical protein n=1 Tax=Maribacter sp. ACAM166 TaxID=2508996 RepID=UPI0010FE70BE|nr:hypothetical protein [Maribacter sp. ACAM166]TLP81359.1 hypothetical protein ES765_04955 [Maribacter sp. ACAM166]